jgi:peptidoglycan/xylan/chitin deacetylase (PgdA/CDA1 family)
MGVPILTYHSIDESGSVISTRPAVFRAQMDFLAGAGFAVASLRELTENLRAGCPLPPRAVAMTFDDGYRNFLTEAFPALARHGFTATVFVVTDHCGGDNAWPGHEEPPAGRLPLLAWGEIQELQRAGVEFGSHTATHPDLTRAAPSRIAEEIARSKASLEDRLGVETALFAYPYGRLNAAVRAVVAREFRGACTTRLGKLSGESDPFLLPRVDMYYLARRGLYERLATRPLDWYLGARQALREVKERMGHG